MNNLVFGKYIPLDTYMHKMDPRAKLTAVIILMIAVFIPKNWYAYGCLALVIMAAVFSSGLKPSFIAKSFKPIIFMTLFLLVINCLSVRTGYELFYIGSFAIYSDAIFNTLFIAIRLMMMIMITTTLTATTKPLDLTLGLEDLLSPLGKVGFPYHEVAMMISIALRFIPTIIEETMRIMNSQKSRGVDFDEGSLKEKVSAILSLIVPLFSVAFQRAYELADAMEARGYVPGAERTRYRVLKFKAGDYIFLTVCLLIMGSMIMTRIYL